MFDDDKIYFTDDSTLRLIASRSTWAHWRCEDRGPAYLKLGARVGYSGRDLNRWLAARTVRPKDTAA